MAIASQSDAIESCIKGAMEEAGLDIVQIRMLDGKNRKTLQISLDSLDGSGITVDQCAKANRTISALLDVEDIISGEYNLEVGSPGIDRPLRSRADFERYAGFDAKVETVMPIDGRRRYSGQIASVSEDHVTMQLDGEVFKVPLDQIQSAKLKLTDALIQAEQARRKQQNN